MGMDKILMIILL